MPFFFSFRFLSFQFPQVLVVPNHRCIPRRSGLKVSRCELDVVHRSARARAARLMSHAADRPAVGEEIVVLLRRGASPLELKPTEPVANSSVIC
jgi:hypothetical protein